MIVRVRFTDPFEVDFADVGTRTTGTQAGESVITGPGWQGQYRLHGAGTIAEQSVLVIGRGRILGIQR